MLERLWRKRNRRALLEMQMGAATVETVLRFLKKLKMEIENRKNKR